MIHSLVKQCNVVKLDGWAWVEGDYRVLDTLYSMLGIHHNDGFFFQEAEWVVEHKLLKIPRGLVLNTPRFPTLSFSSSLFTLRPDQSALVNKFISNMKEKNLSGGIIKAATGSGKSVMGIHLLHYFGNKTLIIVPTERIMSQWIEFLQRFGGFLPEEIGIIKGAKCQVKDKKVCVGMIHTLCKNKYPIQDSFGTVIYDEIHTLGAETFSRVASLFDCQWRIGLSATPRRKDGMENMFLWHIGPILAESSKQNAKPNVIMYNYKDVNTNHNGCVWNGQLGLGKYVNRIARNRSRNQLIADSIFKAWANDHNILMLSDRLQQLEDIKKCLLEYKIPSSEIGFITNKKKDIESKIILATYGSAGMGLDIPRLSCLVFATPRTDIEQAVGRILRTSNAEKTPLVIDITDTCSSIMQGWGKKRMSYYDKNANEVHTLAKEVRY